MPRSTRKKSKTGICHVMQGQESKTCPYDFQNKWKERQFFYHHGDKTKYEFKTTVKEYKNKKK